MQWDIGDYKTLCKHHDLLNPAWGGENWAKYLVGKSWFVCEPCYLKNLAGNILKCRLTTRKN